MGLSISRYVLTLDGESPPTSVLPLPTELQIICSLSDKLRTKMSAESPADLATMESIWQARVHPQEFPAPDFAVPSVLWKRYLGFQSPDPFSDIRGGGRLSAECLEYFVTSEIGMEVLTKCQVRRDEATAAMEAGSTSFSSYPLAPALINMTRFVAELFNVCGPHGTKANAETTSSPLYTLLRSERDFHVAVAGAMHVLDEQWVQTNATYMQFPFVMERTKEVVREMLMLRVREQQQRQFSNN